MTTLENLYNGNINPSDLDELKYNPEYSRALNRVCAARQKLTDSLSAEQRELLERYISSSPSLYLEYKRTGLRFGVLSFCMRETGLEASKSLNIEPFSRLQVPKK